MLFRSPAGGFPSELQSKAGYIWEKRPCDRAAFLAELLVRFWSHVQNLPQKSFVSSYRQRSYLTGKSVAFYVQGVEQRGIVEEIDEQCQLVVRLSNGTIYRLCSGEAELLSEREERGC